MHDVVIDMIGFNSFSPWIFINRVAGAIIRLVASIRPFDCGHSPGLNYLTFDLDFWHEGRPWPWLACGYRSRSYVKGQVQTVKIVYTVPFEPVVQCRSILGLGLPSSANGNCEWPLPVHWNCLFVSNQGAFNVSRVSGWSALIWQ